MPAFEGLRELRILAANNPTLGPDQLVPTLLKVNPDAHTLDLEAALSLHCIVDVDAASDGTAFYQDCIGSLLTHHQPTWAKLMTLGRQRFTRKLNRDERSIFRQADLLVDPPNSSIIQWWDLITGRVRLEADRIKLEQARAAERLTLEIEEQRLIAKGISEKPKWIAIEDNTAGYDVLSYDKNAFGLVNKLIEVKSTIASPLRFYLTRHEWDQALGFGDAYCFHIWNMKQKPPILHEKKASDVAPHVPQDNEKGKWKNAEIPVNI